MFDYEQVVVTLPDTPASAAPEGGPNPRATVVQLLKFGTVGVANTVIDIAVLNGLILVTGHGRFGAWYAFFKAVSFLVAVTNSYLMNSMWTFRAPRQKPRVVQFTSFLIASIVGLVVNVAAAYIVVTVAHPIARLSWAWPSIGALVGSGSGLTWNYVCYRYLVFANNLGSRRAATDASVDTEAS